MVIRNHKSLPEFGGGDRSLLRELLHPGKAPLAIRYSLAHAVVGPGGRTLPHRLESSEVYYVLEGRGVMHVDGERRAVGRDDAVYIPPRAVQHIENPGPGELSFLCIVDPAWRAEDEEILEESPP